MARMEQHGGAESPLRDMLRISAFRSEELGERLGRGWWVVLLSGIGWIVVTAIVLRFDYGTVVAVSILFGILVITIGAAELAMAAVSRGWWQIFHGLLGAIFVVTGVVAFFTPGDTFVGLAAVISFYFVFAGVFDVVSSLATQHVAGWWVQLVAGLVELAVGFWAAGSWRVSAALLVGFVGAMTLIRGVTQIAFAFSLHTMHESARRR